LTLENKDVEKAQNSYTKDLSGLAAKHSDAIGYAFAVDGKVNSADIYASHDLFVKLWPKLLNASAVEAVAAPKPSPSAPPAAAKPDDVRSFLIATEDAKPTEKKVSDGSNQITKDSLHGVFFETQDTNQKNAWMHRSYMSK
jgi:hypothetical protein